MKRFTFFFAGAALIVINVKAQIPFSTSPTWVSTQVSDYSTGAAWADINRDGWMDLVIANGNDMARQRLVVYYNNLGTIPTTPSWQSSDIDYHGHLTVGDVNGDGYADVAVSVYIGAAGFSQKGRVKLYMNNQGTLSTSPSWKSRDSMYTFSCAFGDADGDGDLDLAVAGGESYYAHPEQDRIYYNHGGQLDSLPGWKAAAASYSYDVTWGDIDVDGDLDLLYAREQSPNVMFTNFGDSIGTVPSWLSTDASMQANSMFVGDVNGDAYPDLVISDNNQLGGTGRFKLYPNTAGTLNTIPSWTSAFSGYGSGITLADVDFDGDRDLVTGGWWQPLRIYSNQAGVFTTSPQWTSATGSVVEAIVFADYDHDGLDTVVYQWPGDGTRGLFYLPRAPLQSLSTVMAGSDTLWPDEYACDLENGWISLSMAPAIDTLLVVKAVVSHDIDMAVSNWDSDDGNYIFKNTIQVNAIHEDRQPRKTALYPNFPNPFNPSTRIRFFVSEPRNVSMDVFNVRGQLVKTLVRGRLSAGEHTIEWNGRDAMGHPAASGVYVVRLTTDRFSKSEKMLLIK